MFYFGFQIVLLFLFFIILGYLSKPKAIRFLLIFMGGLFVVLQLVSVVFNGALINYRFFEQLNFADIWSVKDFFDWYIVVFSLLFIALLFAMLHIVRAVRKRDFKPIFSFGALLVLGILFFLPNGVGANIYEIVSIKTAKVGTFHSALEELGIDSKKYVSREEIEAEPGKNIIVLSLESFERGYLEPPLEYLTPNMNAIAEEYSYIKMEQERGSSWTSASMYTSITGVPTYFKSGSNMIFQGMSSTKLGNLGTVLQEAGYEMSYLLTKKDFSGMGDMLESFGFEVKSEFGQNYQKSRWGIQDKDMFQELKKEILKKHNDNEPYAIFLSTISGHFPHGIYDERMKEFLPARDTHLEFMASATDYYIGGLFAFLEEHDILKNTEVFIYPDHQLPGKISDVLKKFAEDRGLFVITTADEQKTLKGVTQPVLQVDIPRMIINGAGIQTNATFLSSFINTPKLPFLYRNRKNFLVLNEAAMKRKPHDYKAGFELKIRDSGKIELTAIKNSFKQIFIDPPPRGFSVIHLSNDLRFISQRTVKHTDSRYKLALKTGYYASEIASIFNKAPKGGYFLIYSVVNDSLYAYLKKGKYIGVARTGKGAVTFTKEEIASLKGWNVFKEGPKIKADEIFLRSTAWEYIPEYGKSQIYIGLKPLEVKRGINLLYIGDYSYQIYNTDYNAGKDAIEQLLNKLKNLTESQKLAAIVVHDSWPRRLKNHTEELKKMGLQKLANLEFRQAYIGLLQNGNFIEKTGSTAVMESFPLKELSNPNIQQIKRDTMRFIAHAGGSINGDWYTNSLEAMNASYKKGFRLLELDIVKTSDNIYVAAHDWKQWSKKTGYTGKTPVNLETFLKNPIEDYTPMTIKDINRWFRNHPDAILVTDKTNDPKNFSKKFIDKDRLMMELFSRKAAKEAQKLGITAILTDYVLLNVQKGKRLEFLRSLGIEHLAFSRFNLFKNRKLLKRLKAAGIKTYVFRVYGNYEVDYFLKNEMDAIYGFYANRWDFDFSEKEPAPK